jgi:hypothetical protein
MSCPCLKNKNENKNKIMGAGINLAEERVEWKRLVYEAKNRLRFVEPRQ